MFRTAALAVVLLAALYPQSRAQNSHTGESSLQFEVATLKPNTSGANGGGIRPTPGGERYQATNVTLRLMMTVAWRVKNEQIVGGPDWMNTATWDMVGKAEKPSTPEELHVMLQNLLVERFHLKFHHDKKEMPMYAITVDRASPKMQPHEAKNSGEPWIDVQQEQFLHMKWHATFAPMDFFAWRLSLALDRPVVDMTNLKGGYDWDLAYTRDLPPNIPEGAQINGQPIDTSGPTIFEAMQKQLGLKLEKQKGPVDIIVVDSADKAVEN